MRTTWAHAPLPGTGSAQRSLLGPTRKDRRNRVASLRNAPRQPRWISKPRHHPTTPPWLRTSPWTAQRSTQRSTVSYEDEGVSTSTLSDNRSHSPNDRVWHGTDRVADRPHRPLRFGARPARRTTAARLPRARVRPPLLGGHLRGQRRRFPPTDVRWDRPPRQDDVLRRRSLPSVPDTPVLSTSRRADGRLSCLPRRRSAGSDVSR
jgi:hypothetical protein